MLLQIAVRVPGEQDPLGLLSASLRRHLSRLRALSFAGDHLLDLEPEQRARALSSLVTALGFFRLAADDPFREEAESLFPRLLDRVGDDPELAQACETLGGDRRRAAALHAEIALHARAFLEGAGDAAGAHALASAVDELDELYRGHLERLELQIFPRARTAFDAGARQSLAGEMLESAWATMLPDDGPEQPAVTGLP